MIECINNAIEHGNLALTGKEKVNLKSKGEEAYWEELHRRANQRPFSERTVTISASITPERAVFTITDQGDGFDTSKLPDPNDPANHLAPSGRGIILASAFLDEVRYNDQGNEVTLIKNRQREPAS